MERIVYREFCDINDLHSAVKHDYSLFKHGSFKETLAFATLLGSEIAVDIVTRNSKLPIVFIGAPFNKVPVASTFLAHYAAMTTMMHTGKHIEVLKVDRQHSYHDDYGDMNAEDRNKSLSGESFTIDPNLLKGKLVYFIDDIYITGAHERRMVNAIEKMKDVCDFNFTFCYFLKLTDPTCDPKIEKLLNNHTIDLNELTGVVSAENTLLVNTRLTKLVLRSDIEVFKAFIASSSLITARQLLIAAEANSYHMHPLYETNYYYLKERLEKC